MNFAKCLCCNVGPLHVLSVVSRLIKSTCHIHSRTNCTYTHSIHTYILTYIHSIHTYILTHIHSIDTHLHSIHTTHTYIPTFIHAHTIASFVHDCISLCQIRALFPKISTFTLKLLPYVGFHPVCSIFIKICICRSAVQRLSGQIFVDCLHSPTRQQLIAALLLNMWEYFKRGQNKTGAVVFLKWQLLHLFLLNPTLLVPHSLIIHRT